MYELIILIAIVLSGCGENQSLTPGFQVPGPPPLPTPLPSVIPTSIPTATPTPSCKPVESNWQTPSTPLTKLLGVYTGPPTSMPIYTLDLSNLQTGINTFRYDASHVCYYDVTRGSNWYRIESFQGCNPGEIPPGHPANEQCDYCPDAYTTGHTFTYALSCSSLTITDTASSQSISYQ